MYPMFVSTIFVRTPQGAVTDLRGSTCSALREAVLCPVAGGSSVLPGPSTEIMWGTIFLAAVPMLLMSFYVLIRKQMPGLVFNIFGGIIALVVMIWILVNINAEAPGEDFLWFLRLFMMIYTSVCWKGLVNFALIVPKASDWLEDVKTWLAAVNGVAFFITIHFVLEIPFQQEAWRWIVYGLLALLQMVLSAVVERTVPMVTGALAAFVLAWKIGFEISGAFDFGSPQVSYLVTFAIIGLEGVGIILAAIAFARNQNTIQEWVRKQLSALRCCCRKPEPTVET